YDFLHCLSTSEELAFSWRRGGAAPTREAFLQWLGDGPFAQFVVRSSVHADPIGYLFAYDPDFANRLAFQASIFAPELIGRGWIVEASALFINYLFATWDFRKLYFQTTPISMERFSSEI